VKHFLIEYEDGSFQWIENSSEKEINKLKIKKIKSESFGKFYFTKKRWKESKKSQFKITFIDPPPENLT
jgi:16S rRNA G966 N2-methylase RsmD